MNSPVAHQDYREYLRQEWLERQSRNPRYSLRAFARDLSLGAARLSNVLNGKKGLSLAGAKKLAKSLGLNEFESEYLVSLVEKRHARAERARSEAEKRLSLMNIERSTQKLSLDHFNLISNWYHLAILQLMKMKHYQDDDHWIAKTLGIQDHEVKQAIERMIRLNLVVKDAETGIRSAASLNVAGPDGFASDAVKQFHEQILKRASSAIFLETPETRDLNTVMFPCSAEKVAEVRERIREFSNSIAQSFSSTGGTRVSALSIQFFGLSQTIEMSKP